MRRPPPRTTRPVTVTALVALAACLPLRAAAQTSAPSVAPASSPGWNDSTTLVLVRRAAARRNAQLADTALRDYRALARGTLTFLGQLGDEFATPPRVLQATQVATEVYWRAPDRSRQRVIGTRDTTVLPTDNQFYLDRFGIVQNNFPNVIRVGEGRDVADVPHPLGPAGESLYDFAVRDSLRIRLADRTVRVHEVQVRPRDASRPRLVGTLSVDVDDAQVVRMAFTFTRPSYLDPRNEDVSIVLENALVQGRFWLPRRQEVEVRRTGRWLDFPARGIIRGRWDIGEYLLNQELPPATFAGPELTFAPPEQRRAYRFEGTVLDAVPDDVRMVTDEDVARVQAQARALVQAQVLQRARGSALSARRISDFARVNRAEGLALGAGYLARLGAGLALRAQGRYGFADEQAKGTLSLERRWATGAALRLEGFRQYREAGDEQEVSLARNSIAAQELGSDWTDPFDARGVALVAELPVWRGARPTLALSYERQRAVSVRARPTRGAYAPTVPATTTALTALTLGLERPASAGPFGTTLRLAGSLRGSSTDRWVCGWLDWREASGRAMELPGEPGGCGRLALRGSLSLGVEREAGRGRIVTQTTLAGTSGAATAQDHVLFGGPVTAPGYRFHELVGRQGVSQRLEWRVPVPAPAISLGRYGRSPARATLAPFAHAAWVGDAVTRYATGPARTGGWYPSVGAGAYMFFDLLRVDVARGLRDGRWLFSVDVTRDFWRVL